MTLEQMEKNSRRRQRRREEAANAHPAKYTPAIADRLVALVEEYVPEGGRVLDVFAGTGRLLDRLGDLGFDSVGIELEPEWAASRRIRKGSALALPFPDATVDAIVTSPTYGNRMADKDLRPSVAGTYAKGLGRLASEGSSCHLQWGPKYRAFHEEAWAEAARVIRPRGHLLVNMKDHYRNRELQPVSEWHWSTIEALRFRRLGIVFVATPSLAFGANSELRAPGEFIGIFQQRESQER